MFYNILILLFLTPAVCEKVTEDTPTEVHNCQNFHQRHWLKMFYTILKHSFCDICSSGKNHQRHCHRSQQLLQLSSETLTQLSYIVTIVIRDFVIAVKNCHNCHQRHCRNCHNCHNCNKRQLPLLSHIVTIVIWDISTVVTHCHNCHQRHCHSCRTLSQLSSETLAQLEPIGSAESHSGNFDLIKNSL